MENRAFHPLPQWKKRFPSYTDERIVQLLCSCGRGGRMWQHHIVSFLFSRNSLGLNQDRQGELALLAQHSTAAARYVYSGKSHLESGTSSTKERVWQDGRERRNRLPAPDLGRHGRRLYIYLSQGPNNNNAAETIHWKLPRACEGQRNKRNGRVRVPFFFFAFDPAAWAVLWNQVVSSSTTQLVYI